MKVNVDNVVFISETNRNFFRIARLVDGNGAVVILKNNVFRYVIPEYSQLEKVESAKDEEVARATRKLLCKHRKAFEALSK